MGRFFHSIRLLMIATVLTLAAILLYNHLIASYSPINISELPHNIRSYLPLAKLISNASPTPSNGITILPSSTSSPTKSISNSRHKQLLLGYIERIQRSPYNNLACQFARVDPFDPSSMLFYKKLPELECNGNLPSLVYLQNDKLIFNKTKSDLHNLTVDYCVFTKLTLSSKSDKTVEELYTSPKFTQSITLSDDIEHLVTNCYFDNTQVAESFAIRIKKKPHVEQERMRLYKRHVDVNKPKETLSVLMVGIDGMSRHNFIRSMPKTFDFITNKMNALEMHGFNRLGYSTFPNLIRMVSGLSEEELKNKLDYNHGTPMDVIDHKLLWHDFKQAGYRTAMSLDDKQITAFHYTKPGWRKPPWDYYQRPVVLKFSKREDRNRNCVGDVPEVTFQLDYWLQLASLFNNSKETPYFGLSFNQRLTHNSFEKATVADPIYYEWFKEIHGRHVLNNTVLVFFSDHGQRYGYFRQTIPGMIESRNPLLYFIFPDWFRTKYPKLMATFRKNQHRLTTMYDVHETIKDFVNFQAITGKGSLQSRGISLFKEIHRERNCSHADIPTQFCLCQNLSDVKITDEIKQKTATALVDIINKKTQKKRKLCQLFELKEFHSEVKMRLDRKCLTCSYFKVTVMLTPGDSVFRGTVKRNDTSGLVNGLEDAAWLNMDDKNTYCMNDLKVKRYCYCVS